MSRFTRLLFGVLLVCPAAYAEDKKGGELTDPVEILKKADAAAKAVKIARCHAIFEGKGTVARRLPRAEGDVIITGWGGGGPEKFWANAEIKRAESSETSKVTVGGDGEEFFVIDHKTKKAYVDIDPAVIGTTGRGAMVLGMFEYVHPTPFSDEINGEKHELLGNVKIGDEDCYKIKVKYANTPQEAIWCFSKKDFLPRQVERIFSGPEGEEAGQVLTVTKLEVDPKLDENTFKFKLPEGYTRIDDFAP